MLSQLKWKVCRRAIRHVARGRHVLVLKMLVRHLRLVASKRALIDKCLVREEVRGNREMVLIKFDLVGDGRVWEDPERLVVRRG